MRVRGHTILRVSIFVLFLLTFLHRASEYPLADEMAFTRPLLRWVEFGPERWGVWHSPFYPWFMSLLGKVFGAKIAIYRSIGFFSILGAALLVLKSVRLARPEIAESELSLLWFLTLLAPVSLGSSLILDYDNTLLILTTALFFYSLIAAERSSFSVAKKSVGFGLIIGLCLLSKETTPLTYPLAVWILLGSFGWAFLSGLIGVFFFAAVTAVWCKFYGIPFAAVFDMDLLGLKIHGVSQPIPESFLRASYIKLNPVVWMGAPIFALFAWQLQSLLRGRGKAIRGITVIVLVFFFVYTFLLRQMTYHFPKYMSPALLWMPAFFFLVRPLGSRGHPFVWLFALMVFGLIFPDPLALLYDRTATAALSALLFFALPFVGWGIVRTMKREVPDWETIAIFSLAVLSVNYGRTTWLTNRSTTYWYGEAAVTEALAGIEKWRSEPENAGGRIISSAEDIAFSAPGIEFVHYTEAEKRTKGVCTSSIPILFVNRIRESSSLLIAPELQEMRKCFEAPVFGRDVLFTELKKTEKRS